MPVRRRESSYTHSSPASRAVGSKKRNESLASGIFLIIPPPAKKQLQLYEMNVFSLSSIEFIVF